MKPSLIQKHPVRVLFHVQNMSKNAILPEYPNDCKCDIDFK